jgi:tight adherence protein B
MEFVLGTFVGIIAIVYGLYWLMIERPEAQEGSEVRKRLRGATKSTLLRQTAVSREQERLSDLGPLDRVLSHSRTAFAPLQLLITQAGVRVTVGTILLSCAVVALLTFAFFSVYLSMPLLGIVFAVGATWLPIAWLRWMRTRRMLKFEEQFPEAMDLLARALRAGHALTTGLSMVADEMKDPIGPEFRQLFDEQNFGLPLPQALKNFATRIPLLDAKFFVTAVLTQRDAGGNLSEVLDNLATIIRDRFRVKRQVRVISAHGRITGWVLSALPTSLALFFTLTNPQKYLAFVRDPLGMQMVLFALGLQVLGVLIIKKIVTIEY